MAKRFSVRALLGGLQRTLIPHSHNECLLWPNYSQSTVTVLRQLSSAARIPSNSALRCHSTPELLHKQDRVSVCHRQGIVTSSVHRAELFGEQTPSLLVKQPFPTLSFLDEHFSAAEKKASHENLSDKIAWKLFVPIRKKIEAARKDVVTRPETTTFVDEYIKKVLPRLKEPPSEVSLNATHFALAVDRVGWLLSLCPKRDALAVYELESYKDLMDLSEASLQNMMNEIQLWRLCCVMRSFILASYLPRPEFLDLVWSRMVEMPVDYFSVQDVQRLWQTFASVGLEALEPPPELIQKLQQATQQLFAKDESVTPVYAAKTLAHLAKLRQLNSWEAPGALVRTLVKVAAPEALDLPWNDKMAFLKGLQWNRWDAPKHWPLMEQLAELKLYRGHEEHLQYCLQVLRTAQHCKYTFGLQDQLIDLLSACAPIFNRYTPKDTLHFLSALRFQRWNPDGHFVSDRQTLFSMEDELKEYNFIVLTNVMWFLGELNCLNEELTELMIERMYHLVKEGNATAGRIIRFLTGLAKLNRLEPIHLQRLDSFLSMNDVQLDKKEKLEVWWLIECARGMPGGSALEELRMVQQVGQGLTSDCHAVMMQKSIVNFLKPNEDNLTTLRDTLTKVGLEHSPGFDFDGFRIDAVVSTSGVDGDRNIAVKVINRPHCSRNGPFKVIGEALLYTNVLRWKLWKAMGVELCLLPLARISRLGGLPLSAKREQRVKNIVLDKRGLPLVDGGPEAISGGDDEEEDEDEDEETEDDDKTLDREPSFG